MDAASAAAAHRRQRQDDLYNEAHAEYGPALRRLVRGYEAHPDRQADLLQEMHLELWRSLAAFDGRCSLRTWVYRVANNVGPRMGPLVDLEALKPAGLAIRVDEEAHAHDRHSAARRHRRGDGPVGSQRRHQSAPHQETASAAISRRSRHRTCRTLTPRSHSRCSVRARPQARTAGNLAAHCRGARRVRACRRAPAQRLRRGATLGPRGAGLDGWRFVLSVPGQPRTGPRAAGGRRALRAVSCSGTHAPRRGVSLAAAAAVSVRARPDCVLVGPRTRRQAVAVRRGRRKPRLRLAAAG
ncbi:MAG: hypothetical protein FJW31_00715 [Acidobacteria bacterium]|nr:hypothetical protein [Acidobacteriota bacterium]